MAKVTNNFLKGKMNKDLDERLVPKGEYREAQNILITQSDGSDVGAIENILGNALAKGLVPGITTPTIIPIETIGHYIDRLNHRVFWFITDFTGMAGNDITNMFPLSMPTPSSIQRILMAKMDDYSNIKTLVSGHFLNFSKNHLITGVNLIDDLLFWTDNYNQPRKINVTRAIEDPSYYTKEEQISVAKVVPYLAPILHNSMGLGDETTLTNQTAITSDYLKDRFVRFSYRYKYEDGEYTTMAPFTQIVFRPLNEGKISNILTDDYNIQDVYTKTIVDIMKNDYNQIELRIPLPGDENLIVQPDPLLDSITGDPIGYNWDNDLRIVKIEILIKESDEDVVKVIKEIDVTKPDGNILNTFLNNIDIYNISPTGNETYFRYVYKFVYKSEEPYKILEDKQVTRVYDQVPIRAKAQEISGNRLIYGNFTENYNLPRDNAGNIGINYTIDEIVKGETEFFNVESGQGLLQHTNNSYKYNSLKQRRTYQVGIVLADKFGRQSSVILSTNKNAGSGLSDTITTYNYSLDLSERYNNSYSWSEDQAAIGKALLINFRDDQVVNPDRDKIYNGDINSPDYNPYGWYSWKLVVKQQEQDFYNIYTSHPADHWNNESNNSDETLGYTWVSLYGDNINKVTKDLGETDEIREDVAGSDTLLFPKVVKSADTSIDNIEDLNNLSAFGDGGNDPIEVMTVGTAREQGILTDGNRDKERVHDFVMAKRNPLLAQLKNLGSQATNNKVQYKINAKIVEQNDEDTQYFKIGDGSTINPFIRPGQEIMFNPQIISLNRDWAGMGKPAVSMLIEKADQRYDDSVFGNKTLVVKAVNVGKYSSGAGDQTWYDSTDNDAYGGHQSQYHGQIKIGQYVDFQQVHFDNEINHSMSTIVTNGDEEVVRFPKIIKVESTKGSESERMIIHFDRPPIRDDAQVSQLGNSIYVTLYDPLLIEDVDNITENGLVYQKIKMSHSRTMGALGPSGAGSANAGGTLNNTSPRQISIQNIEHDPIAVTTGLTVLETNPVKSKLDIFYETSTSGLISDLNSLTSTTTTGPSELSFQANQDEDFTENQPADGDTFTIGTFSSSSQNTSSDNILYINPIITRGSYGELVLPGTFDIASGSDELVCTTSLNFRVDDPVNAALLGDTQEPDPNANKFYGEFTAYDGEYTTQSFTFELKNYEPSITIKNSDVMPFSLHGASDGLMVASGSIYNGCANPQLSMHDMAVEIVSDITWLNGLPVFSIQQIDNDENLYHITFNTYQDEANSVLWLQNTYGDENDILYLDIKVIDAGGAEATATVEFTFDLSLLEVWVMSPMVNQIGDTSGLGEDFFQQNSYPSDTTICDLGMDATTVDQFGQYLTPGWVKVWVAKGDANLAPHTIENFIPPSTITDQNPDGVSSPNNLNVSNGGLGSAGITTTGVQLYKKNIVYQDPTGTIPYGAAIMPEFTVPLKYFNTHVCDNSQGISNWEEKKWEHFTLNINGEIGTVGCCGNCNDNCD